MRLKLNDESSLDESWIIPFPRRGDAQGHAPTDLGAAVDRVFDRVQSSLDELAELVDAGPLPFPGRDARGYDDDGPWAA